MPIHPTAIVDRKAEIDPTAEICAYVIIDGEVKIGPGVKVYPHAYISGWTEIGERCQIHPNAIVGHLPQDFHFKGERSYCRIGAGTIIRELATIHRGTQPESWTILGKDCFILTSAHVGHNCELADGVKVYNNTALAGHVTVGMNSIVSAHSLLHQFIRIGDYVMVGARSLLKADVPHYMKAWHLSRVMGYNSIGLKRSGQFSAEDIDEVRRAYKTLFRSELPLGRKIEEYAGLVERPIGRRILEFVKNPSRMGICGGDVSSGDDETEAFE